MQQGTDTVSFADKNSSMTVFLHLENEEQVRLSIFNGEREQEAISLLVNLDKTNRVMVPVEYRSEFDDNDFLNKISEESKQKQLTGFIYTVFSGIVNNGFVLTSEKEVLHENEVHEEQEHGEAIEDNFPAPQQQNRINYRLREVSELPEGGPKTRFAWNIEAIRTLKQIEKEQRLATADEQSILARYVGWGGLANAFDSHNQSWVNEYDELKELLTEDEYASARESTLTAFYTPPEVISGIYTVLNNLGFNKGNILEPACGTGNFLGMLPETMEGSNLYGIELDSLSGRIAKQLYQNSNIAIEGFEKTSLPDQFFDVAVGNVPFGQFGVIDDAYKNENFMIHDYFFAKALSKVRPGGVIAFITSKGTMDKKDPKVREYIAKRADLLGAIRLPNNVFSGNAGTTVTSDILILQKRDRQRLDMPSWTKTGVNEDGFELNNYFIEHPDMVLGRLSMDTGQGGRLDLACLPDESKPFKESFMDAVSKINGQYEALSYELEDMEEDLAEAIPADISIQNFGYTLIDDVVYQRRDSMMYPVETNATALNRIRALIPLRETLRELIDAQLNEESDEQVTAYQKKLNELYDAFIGEFGYINSQGNSRAFSDDSSYYLLCSLERFNDEDEYIGKADIFTKRTVRKKEVITEAQNSLDALALSIGEKGRVD
ncbi:MAG: N-6 DNA methylase, partial [Anaerovoracaceae bacterium]